MKVTFEVFMLFILFALRQDFGGDNTITISVAGIRHSMGTILINLYKAAEGFPTDMSKAYQRLKMPASTTLIQVDFRVPGGTYALSILHDANDNGKMDKNIFGIPTEGYCVSNNAKGFMSAPSFVNASFNLKSKIRQTLQLTY